jgi:hypothetical protein
MKRKILKIATNNVPLLYYTVVRNDVIFNVVYRIRQNPERIRIRIRLSVLGAQG